MPFKSRDPCSGKSAIGRYLGSLSLDCKHITDNSVEPEVSGEGTTS